MYNIYIVNFKQAMHNNISSMLCSGYKLKFSLNLKSAIKYMIS